MLVQDLCSSATHSLVLFASWLWPLWEKWLRGFRCHLVLLDMLIVSLTLLLDLLLDGTIGSSILLSRRTI